MSPTSALSMREFLRRDLPRGNTGSACCSTRCVSTPWHSGRWPQAEAEATTTPDGGRQLLGMLESLNPGVLAARLSSDGAVAVLALRVQTAAGASRFPSFLSAENLADSFLKNDMGERRR